jgi:CRISPR/Cas system-associated exonuclease Cas4 (RecB family)
MAFGLSKSKVMYAFQCPRRLWLEVKRPQLAQSTQQAAHVMQLGNDIHETARTLFPNGMLIENVDDLKIALRETQAILKNSPGTPVFEGAFTHNGVLIRADMLFPDPSGARLVEVKAAGSLRDYYLQDCAIQAWVIEGAGVPLKKVEVATVDTSFVYPGRGDYRGLFRYQDVTDRVRSAQGEVPLWVWECFQVLEGPEPMIPVGKQCEKPYDCPFMDFCSPEQGPEYPLACLPNAGSVVQELQDLGIDDIRQIPDGYLKSPNQERVRRVTISGKAEVDPAAGTLLRGLPYPRYFLDFETINPAVPIWAGTRPYQQVPFQWSCHIQQAPGKLDHEWFLDTTGNCPMRGAAESLLSALRDSGPIFMYSDFEKRIIRELAAFLPDLAGRLTSIVRRLTDLKPIVKDRYYHPQMKGSWSLKSVAECINPGMSHANLQEVTDGTAAQRAYLEIVAPETDQTRRDDLRKKLLDYCTLDTMAMARIVEFLQSH